MKAKLIVKSSKLNEELRDYAVRIKSTNLLLQKFLIVQELNRTGLLLTPKEAERQAQVLSQNMIDCNLIQNGVIVPGMLEHILEVAECR